MSEILVIALMIYCYTIGYKTGQLHERTENLRIENAKRVEFRGHELHLSKDTP